MNDAGRKWETFYNLVHSDGKDKGWKMHSDFHFALFRLIDERHCQVLLKPVEVVWTMLRLPLPLFETVTLQNPGIR